MNTWKPLLLAVAISTCAVLGNAAEKLTQPSIEQQSYALYLLYHPKKNEQSTAALSQNFVADYSELFKSNKKVNKSQFIDFEMARLKPLLEQRREMSLKQTHVRFGILDKNKDQRLTLKEFQEVGIRGFDEWDKNKDGLVNAEDIKLSENNQSTHDGFKVKLPISMPMPSNVKEFIQQYGKDKAYVTLGDYLTARDQQFFATDLNKDSVVTESEYVEEFMKRFDQNTESGSVQMQKFFADQFDLISKGKVSIQASDIQKFAKQVDRQISQ